MLIAKRKHLFEISSYQEVLNVPFPTCDVHNITLGCQVHINIFQPFTTLRATEIELNDLNNHYMISLS